MPARLSRKRLRRLKAAITLAGYTVEEFATTLGITSAHLRLVVQGKRESPRVMAAVEAIIARHLTNNNDEAA